MALHNCSGIATPRQGLCNVWYYLTRFVLCSGCVYCSSSTHRVPGKDRPQHHLQGLGETLLHKTCIRCDIITNFLPASNSSQICLSF